MIHINKINCDLIPSNENGSEVSFVKINHQRAQRECWNSLLVINQYIDLNNVDVVQLLGDNIGAYTALLARQFPSLNFEFDVVTECRNSSRVLWLSGENVKNIVTDITNFHDIMTLTDAVIVSHSENEAWNVLRYLDGFARIAAIRDIGNGCSLSIFGRGLMRDIFKPKVRG